jgi:hypothetical protein
MFLRWVKIALKNLVNVYMYILPIPPTTAPAANPISKVPVNFIS